MKARHFIATALALGACAWAHAQDYPAKTVRVIVPFAPGGSNDIVGRLLAAHLSDRTGKQFVIDNRGGAGGLVGTEMVWKSPPDGYTLLVISVAFPMNAAVYKLPYDPIKAFTPVVLLATGSEVSLCVEAAQRLADAGVAARVVSMPSWDRFERQTREYRSSVLPSGVPVLSVEAGVTYGWARWADDSIGIDRFGASAPGGVVMERLGLDVANVAAMATALVTERKG